ncbi:MAG: hypothetical protein JST89_00305 [Cyanobacteria bacterium SZAS-4]|nr:hypothetical protein [Cyanobacteria bacterium SZAS-4]
MSTGTESAQNYDADRRKEGDRGADGKSTAAEKLFADSREANKGANGGQFDNATIAKLEQQGILPQLAIEFTKTADANDLDGDGDTTETVYSAIDTDGQGGITQDELQVARSSQNASVLDKRLLQQLGTDYDDIRFTLSDTGVEGIAQNDIDTYLASKDADLSNDTQVRDASARLLLNPDLFNLADTASNGGTGDGQISKDDLKTLIDKYGKNELPSSVSQADIAAMQFLVDNWNESFVGGDNTGIRDTKGDRDTQKGTGLTRASIEVGLGLPVDGSGNQTLFDQVNGVDSQFGQQYAAAYKAKYNQDFPSTEETTTTTTGDSTSTTTTGDTPSPTSGNPSDTIGTTRTDANGATIHSYNGDVLDIKYADGKTREFGYLEDGTLADYTDKDGTVYTTRGHDGVWTNDATGQPAPFQSVAVDASGNVSLTTDGVTQTYDTAGNPPFEQPIHTTDANGAHITTHRGKVTEVGYLDGTARDFGYDDNNDLIAYKDADGKVYTRDNTSSPWVNSEDGQPAPFSDVAVDQAGNVTVTKTDGTTVTYDSKNEQVPAATADAPPATDAPATDAPTTDAPTADAPADTVETYTVQSGQGFDKIARDVYTQALGHPPTAAEERALSELIAAANNNDRSYSGGVLHTGDELVVPNLKDLQAQADQQGVPLETYIRSASQQIVASLQTPADSSAPADDSAAADDSVAVAA